MYQLQQKWLAGKNPDTTSIILSNEEKVWLSEQSSLDLGIDSSWAPLEFIDEDGKYSGIASSYIEAISQRLDIKMNPIPDLTWSQVIEKAKKGEIDILPAVVRTPDREKYLNFTKPYISFPVVIATEKNAQFVSELNDLSGWKVGVVKDYYLEEILSRDFPDLVLVPRSSLTDGLKALNEGEIDAFVDSLIAISFAIIYSSFGNIKIAAPTGLKFELSMGIRKDSDKLLGIVNKALDSISYKEKVAFNNIWMAVQIKYGIDLKAVLLWVLPIGSIALVIIIIVLIWNRKMGKEIQGRRQAEKRLEGSMSQLQNILDTSPIGVGFSTKGSMQSTNPRFTEMFDIKVGEPAPDLYVNIEDRDILIQRLNKEGRVENLELQLYGRNKKVLDVLTTYLTIDYYGEEGVLGWFLDITERKQMELEYIASERKVTAMSKAVEDALIMLDSHGKVRFWNPAAEKLFGYSTDEAMGMDFHDMTVSEDAREMAWAGMEDFGKTGQGKAVGTTIERQARNRQGKEFPVEVTVSSFQVDDEWFAVGTVRDITTRKRAEQEMQQNMEELEQFSKVAIGREEKMIQLKEELNQMLEQAGQEKKYQIVE
jgi:PAS domain S-box-containing protein